MHYSYNFTPYKNFSSKKSLITIDCQRYSVSLGTSNIGSNARIIPAVQRSNLLYHQRRAVFIHSSGYDTTRRVG